MSDDREGYEALVDDDDVLGTTLPKASGDDVLAAKMIALQLIAEELVEKSKADKIVREMFKYTSYTKLSLREKYKLVDQLCKEIVELDPNSTILEAIVESSNINQDTIHHRNNRTFIGGNCFYDEIKPASYRSSASSSARCCVM